MVKHLFAIGKVVKPHGIKGKVKVEYFGEDYHLFSLNRRVFIEVERGRPKPYEILEAIPQPPRLILRFKGVDRVQETETLIGRDILVEKEILPELEKGEYYWMDILGMEVETLEGRRIGKVKAIFPTGANDVYVVEGKRGEILLPATEEVIQSIDLQSRVMKVNRMEGLWEDEDEV